MSTIGLNAQLLNLSASYRGAGIHHYIHQLLLALPQIAPQHRYEVYLNERRALWASAPDGTMRMHYTRWPTQKPLARIVWEQSVLPLATIRDGLDLLHALAFARPVLARCPVVLTIYDMSFERMGQRFPFWQRTYLRAMTRYAARHAARIIVISQSGKDDVVAYCGVPADRVHVVYCGADEQFSPRGRAQVDQFRAAKGLP